MTGENRTESSVDRVAVGLFAAFAFLLAAFNRGFVYLHLTLSGRPVFVTEPFLVTVAALLLVLPARRALFSRRGDKAVTAALLLQAVFLLLVVIKLATALPKFGLEAVRQSALGYYSLAVPVSFALFSDGALRDRLFRIIGVGSALSTLLFLVDASGRMPQGVILLREFHGFGAFIWIGVVTAWLLATGRVEFRSCPAAFALFVLHTSVGFMLAGRSEFLALLLSLGGIVLLRFAGMSTRQRMSLGGAALVAALCLGLRFNDVLVFKSQDNWKQSWASYRWGARTFHEAVSSAVAPADETAATKPNAVPETDLLSFDDQSGTLRSVPASLNGADNDSDENSASVNNVLWRKELWRLSTKATLQNAPVFGLPLGTTLEFYVFDRRVPGRVDLHNSHLAFFYRFGAAGVLLYLALVLTCAAVSARGFSRRSGIPVFYVAALGYLTILAGFNVMLEGPYGALVFWGLLGAGLADGAARSDGKNLIHQSKEHL